MGVSMFNDTITIYNKLKEGGRERWQRRVVSGVNWTDIRGAVARKTGVTPSDSFSLVIPMGAMQGYVKPAAFAALEDKKDAWTVAPEDAVVLGALDVEIITSPGKDLSTFDDVREVTAIDSLIHGRLAHLEVSGH